MSLIYNQTQEITLFLLDNDVKDIDELYERLVVKREKKIQCFRKRTTRKTNEETFRVIYRDITKDSFEKIIKFMNRIKILKSKPLNLLESNREILEDNPLEKFNILIEEIIKLYFEKYGFKISDLKEKIKKIRYPKLRDSKTIQKKFRESKKSKKMIGISDFNKLLTLLSDIGILERVRPILFLE